MSGASEKRSTANAGDTRDSGSISGLGRSPEGGNGNPLQYSCLENSMDRRAWQARDPWDLKELDMTERLSQHSLNLEASLVAEMVKSNVLCQILLVVAGEWHMTIVINDIN